MKKHSAAGTRHTIALLLLLLSPSVSRYSTTAVTKPICVSQLRHYRRRGAGGRVTSYRVDTQIYLSIYLSIYLYLFHRKPRKPYSTAKRKNSETGRTRLAALTAPPPKLKSLNIFAAEFTGILEKRSPGQSEGWEWWRRLKERSSISRDKKVDTVSYRS